MTSIDKTVKNGWNWQWLSRTVNEEKVSENIRKLNEPGIARCILCNKNINYGNRGWKSVEQHILQKIHAENRRTKASNQCLPGK